MIAEIAVVIALFLDFITATVLHPDTFVETNPLAQTMLEHPLLAAGAKTSEMLMVVSLMVLVGDKRPVIARIVAIAAILAGLFGAYTNVGGDVTWVHLPTPY